MMIRWALLLLLIISPLFSRENHDKWIVVTTIQYPTEQLKEISRIPGWQLVVVGDQKTPKDWYLENCHYLSPEKQLELGYELATVLPWNHYSRKNIGYLYAIENGAKIIYETDDDNQPIGELSPLPHICQLPSLISSSNSVNVYCYFGQSHVWPRGYPFDKIKEGNSFQTAQDSLCAIGIEQGVVNQSPDVDAIFRLTQNDEIFFEKTPPCYLPKNCFCPFNSQNTFIHEPAFYTMYIPSTPTMRVSDIWRGYIAQKLIWKDNLHLVFSGPNAIQERNVHSLMNDFILEKALYMQASDLVNYLSEWNGYKNNSLGSLLALYRDLVRKKFVEKKEIQLLKAWSNDFKKIESRNSLKSI